MTWALVMAAVSAEKSASMIVEERGDYVRGMRDTLPTSSLLGLGVAPIFISGNFTVFGFNYY